MIDPLRLWVGTPVPIPELAITIHQPSVHEIAYAGEDSYARGAYLLCISKNNLDTNEDGKVDSFLEHASNFSIFMQLVNSIEFKERKQDVITTLTLLFPDYKIMFTPRSLIFMLEQQSTIIDDNNFDVLQEYIKDITCYKESDEKDYNPQDDKAREIAEKLKRGRQRVAAQKAKENSTASALTQYISSLVVGLKIDPISVQKLTMYAVYDLLERMRLNTEWDLDIKAKLAGATGTKEPENWMKNIH